MKPHLFPFLRADAEEELSTLYRRVVATMTAIHEDSQEPSDLVAIAQNWYDHVHSVCLYREIENMFTEMSL